MRIFYFGIRFNRRNKVDEKAAEVFQQGARLGIGTPVAVVSKDTDFNNIAGLALENWAAS